jgi:polysaccharide biosynthesis/export protein
MRTLLIFIMAAELLCLSSCAGFESYEYKTVEYDTASDADETTGTRIDVGDKISIKVWRVPLLSQDVLVGLDGTFLYPLLGTVPAEGKTSDELRDYLTEALGKDYLVDPLVTVSLEGRAQGFFVVGEVKAPGPKKLSEKIDIYQAIIISGGFTDFASKNVKIIRKTKGEKRTLKFDIKQFAAQTKTDPEAIIRPGDIIVVEKRLF